MAGFGGVLYVRGKPFDPPRGTERESPRDPLARFLGWASAALGIPMLASPRRFDRAIGVPDDASAQAWTLVVGVREIVVAACILSERRPAEWLWSRVAGDVMDLTLLASALRKDNADRGRILGAMGAVVAIGAADVTASLRNTGRIDAEHGRVEVKGAITVRRSPEEAYRFWHEFENLPVFMTHLESVRTNNGRSHWTAKGPAGRRAEWDAEIVEDLPNEMISWRSVDGAAVPNAGRVRFTPAPGGRGTEIRLDMSYSPPGGVAGAVALKFSAEDPQRQVRDDLHRFKQVIETGVVVRSDGTPEGTDTRRLINQRPAQPLAGRT
jgi:uncharacterized membrane protein